MHRILPTQSLLALVGAVATSSLAAQWTPVSPGTQPAARAGHAMAGNPAADGILLFGGAGGFTQYADTWTYDGTAWTRLFPPVSPPPKFFTAMVYDSARAVYVLYGGNATFTQAGNNETWEFDGTTWTQRFPPANPGNLGGHAMAFDSVRNRVVLFGGIQTVAPINDSLETWEYTGTTWVNRNPTGTPGRLEHHSMCFHAAANRTILFGGVNANPSTPPNLVANDKTWAYDGLANTWTELTISGPRPFRRERATLTYDPIRQVCILTGGLRAQSSGAAHDTWELSHSNGTWTWTLVDDPTVGGRVNSGAAFLPIQRHLVKFGGSNAAGGVQYQETLEWGAQNGSFGVGCAGPNGMPMLSAADAPRLGQNYSLTVSNMNPAFNLAILVFGFTAIPGGIDLGPLLDMSGCTGYLTPDILITPPTGAGGTTTWNWTPVAGSLGDRFFCQALCLDPAATNFGFTISNAVSATIGF
jgi:hypothetical protein